MQPVSTVIQSLHQRRARGLAELGERLASHGTGVDVEEEQVRREGPHLLQKQKRLHSYKVTSYKVTTYELQASAAREAGPPARALISR